MASKKSKRPGGRLGIPRPLRYLIRAAWGPGRPVVIALGLVLALVAVWYGLWLAYRDRLLASEEYMVAVEDIEITTPPAWIHSDIRGEAYRVLIVDGFLSIMEPQAAKRVADAFALHPWVARVDRVTKSHPAKIRVELRYRKPACMVEVPGGLYPVDAHGVCLPISDFTGFVPVETLATYPRLSGVETLPLGPPGTPWGDPRVVGAAGIAAAFGSAWQELGLYRILPDQQIQRSKYTFALETRQGKRIYWGLAPSGRPSGEIPAAEKVARLKAIFAEQGSLDAADGLDLRRPATSPVARASGAATG